MLGSTRTFLDNLIALYSQVSFPSPPSLETLKWKVAVAEFARCRDWTTAFSHQWQREEHINSLEAAAAVLALKRAVSFPIAGKRIVVFQTHSLL